MSKRLNITVPDELYAKIKGYRDVINISKTCKKALEAAMLAEDAKEEFKEFGFFDGQNQSKNFSSDEIKKILQIMHGEDRYGRWNHLERVSEASDRFLDENLRHKRFGDYGSTLSHRGKSIRDEDDIAEIYYEYREGWVNGVLSRIDQENS